MVIGYSFGDAHINETIKVTAQNGLKIFIVDTLGVDVADKRSASLDDQMKTLMPQIIGASRRSIREVVESDAVEYGKILRFFEGQIPVVRIAQASSLVTPGEPRG